MLSRQLLVGLSQVPLLGAYGIPLVRLLLIRPFQDHKHLSWLFSLVLMMASLLSWERLKGKKDVHSWCDHPAENWVCLFCKDVLCSRFINKHMLEHYEQKGHCLALSYSDLSVWCFNCDAYLDAQVIVQLRHAHETDYLLKFGKAPPIRSLT